MTERVLIVEDNPLIAHDLEDTIHRLGYVTSGVANDFASAQRLAPFSDIALVDVNLVDGATGPRIAEYLADGFGISVVMVTGNPEAVERGLSKVVGVISKPVTPVIIQTVIDYLHSLKGPKPGIPPAGLHLFPQQGKI